MHILQQVHAQAAQLSCSMASGASETPRVPGAGVPSPPPASGPRVPAAPAAVGPPPSSGCRCSDSMGSYAGLGLYSSADGKEGGREAAELHCKLCMPHVQPQVCLQARVADNTQSRQLPSPGSS